METPRDFENKDVYKYSALSPAPLSDRNVKKSIIEALLFVAGEPVLMNSLTKATDLHESEIKGIIDELSSDYAVRNSGILIVEIAEGFQMITKPDFGVWVKKFKNIHSTSRLSQPALETLSIIAYKQPLTKLEVDQLRGVNSDGPLKSLLDKRLIKIIGKKETPGRPFLYGTTKEFLQYFGLKSLSELPPISDSSRDEAA